MPSGVPSVSIYPTRSRVIARTGNSLSPAQQAEKQKQANISIAACSLISIMKRGSGCKGDAAAKQLFTTFLKRFSTDKKDQNRSESITHLRSFDSHLICFVKSLEDRAALSELSTILFGPLFDKNSFHFSEPTLSHLKNVFMYEKHILPLLPVGAVTGGDTQILTGQTTGSVHPPVVPPINLHGIALVGYANFFQQDPDAIHPIVPMHGPMHNILGRRGSF